MRNPSIKCTFSSRLYLVVTISILIFLASSDLSALQYLTINTPGEPPYHYADQTGILDLWVKEAFIRIGVEATVDWQPPERGLINANTGIIDGDAGRISGISKQYPNLTQVPEVLLVTDYVVFAKSVRFNIAGWQSLKPYNVAIIRGHKIAEENVVDTQSVVKASNTEGLFNLLNSNRADVAVCERLFGSLMANKINPEIEVLEPPLARAKFYLYLHNKHNALVTRVSAALKAMKRDGTYGRLLLQGEKKSAKRR